MRRLSFAFCLGGLLLAAFALPVRADVQGAEPAWADVKLPAAQQLDLRAAGTGRRYRVFVSVPSSPPPATGYPVLYVLDGNAMFPVAAFLSRSVASRSHVTGQVAPLVVGIGYPGEADFDVASRQRDYTPGAGKPDASATEGGADLLLDVIEKDLKPLIASRHRVDPARQALFGHSFGGLFVLHALFTRPAGFSTYLASSPSIWWRDRLVLGELDEKARSGAGPAPRLQISVGALEDQLPGGRQTPEMRAMRASRPMVSEARGLAARLQGAPAWSGRVAYLELEGEDHGTAWLPAMTRGLRFFLAQP